LDRVDNQQHVQVRVPGWTIQVSL